MDDTESQSFWASDYPILQGGMAWVAEHHLAAAVSAAGGLGIHGRRPAAPAEVVREEIHRVRGADRSSPSASM